MMLLLEVLRCCNSMPENSSDRFVRNILPQCRIKEAVFCQWIVRLSVWVQNHCVEVVTDVNGILKGK